MAQAVHLPKFVYLEQAVALLAASDRPRSVMDRRNLLIAGLRDGSVRNTNTVIDVTIRARFRERNFGIRQLGEAHDLPPHFWDPGKIDWSMSLLRWHSLQLVEDEICAERGFCCSVSTEDLRTLRCRLGSANGSSDQKTEQTISPARSISDSGVSRRKRGRPPKFTVEDALEMIPKIAEKSPWAARKLSSLVQAVHRRRKGKVGIATIRKCVRKAMEILRDRDALNFGSLS